jgi:hypothetical protein
MNNDVKLLQIPIIFMKAFEWRKYIITLVSDYKYRILRLLFTDHDITDKIDQLECAL